MNNKFFSLSLITLLCLSFATVVFASGAEAETEGPTLFVNLITLIVVGGVIYNIWVNFSGFGGSLGNALKIVAVGIFMLSVDTIDEVVEGLTEVGSSTLLGEGIVHDVFHSGLMLLGFLVLGYGLGKMSKIVKSMK